MSSAARPVVCVIDDEDGIRNLVRDILESHGFSIKCFGCAADFFREFDESATSCIITDLRLPEVDGQQLQQRLNEMGSIVALVVLTGTADVRTAVRLLAEGALTLLEKPFQTDELVAAVVKSAQVTQKRRAMRCAAEAAKMRLQQLSDDERAVLDCLLAGLANKAIAAKLGLSMRTVDRRRQAVLTKMGVQSTAELAGIVAQLKPHIDGPTI